METHRVPSWISLSVLTFHLDAWEEETIDYVTVPMELMEQ